jgi:hypothetical protein
MLAHLSNHSAKSYLLSFKKQYTAENWGHWEGVLTDGLLLA